MLKKIIMFFFCLCVFFASYTQNNTGKKNYEIEAGNMVSTFILRNNAEMIPLTLVTKNGSVEKYIDSNTVELSFLNLT